MSLAHAVVAVARHPDHDVAARQPATWQDALRRARPGAHLTVVTLSGDTPHRIVAAVEQAGWYVHNTVVYDSGHSGLLPAVIARSPLSEPNVAANVLRHGTGGINVAACAVPAATKTPFPVGDYGPRGLYGADGMRTSDPQPDRRWPPNVVISPAAAARLDTTHPPPSPSRFYPQTTTADELVSWLTRLLCPPGGTVLNPFADPPTHVTPTRQTARPLTARTPSDAQPTGPTVQMRLVTEPTGAVDRP